MYNVVGGFNLYNTLLNFRSSRDGVTRKGILANVLNVPRSLALLLLLSDLPSYSMNCIAFSMSSSLAISFCTFLSPDFHRQCKRLGPPAAKQVHFFLAFPSTFLVKLGGFYFFVLTYVSPRSPLRAEYFGTRIGPVR